MTSQRSEELDEITFPPGAERYYDLEKARKILEKPVPEGFTLWRCVLCGCPGGAWKNGFDAVGASCCPGCGMTCLRPMEEYDGPR